MCLEAFFPQTALCAQKGWAKLSYSRVTQYLCLRTTAVSEFWGRQLDRRSPPPAAEDKHTNTEQRGG